MNPLKAAELYQNECRDRRFAAGTIKGVRLMLNRFNDYCRLHGLADLRDAVPETLLDYHRWMKQYKCRNGEPLQEVCVNYHVRLAKTLFKFLAARHYIMTDIGRDFPSLRNPRQLPRGIMNKDTVMRLLKQPNITTPLGFRDRTMFEVLYSTGLRAGELCSLTLYDFDSKERMIRVNAGKGNKDRIVPVGKVAASYLVEYIKNVRPVLSGVEGPVLTSGERSRTSGTKGPVLACGEPGRTTGENKSSTIFLSATGRKLTTGDLHRILKTHRESAGLPDTITTHSLRHTCATEMLKGGASIRHVQELLGHAGIQSTQIYTHVIPIDLKKAHARTSPSERRRNIENITLTLASGRTETAGNRRGRQPAGMSNYARKSPCRNRPEMVQTKA